MQLSAAIYRRDSIAADLCADVLKLILWPLRALFTVPLFLFLAALTAMLFRHPDVQFYQIDSVAFGVLIVGVLGSVVVERNHVPVLGR